MKVYLIHPKAPPTLEDLSEGLAWWNAGANRAPLDLPLLAALTPPGVELSLTDQQAGDPVNFEENADLVVVVADAGQIPGLRYLCGRFHARRIPVAIGGSYVTRHPSDVDFADIKLVGDLEKVWPPLITDRLNGATPQKVYAVKEPFELAGAPVPRWDLMNLGRYRMVTLEVSRRHTTPGAEGAEATTVQRKPIGLVMGELEALLGLGARRIWLETDDLLADDAYARGLLESLADLNARQSTKLRFETRVSLASVGDAGRLELLANANVRRVELELNAAEIAHPSEHEDPREAIEAVRRLLERGIRVAGRLTLFREGDDALAWETQKAIACESHALPLARAARARPGTALYELLQKAKRLVPGGRDSDLRQELFDVPNFEPRSGSREAQQEQLKALIQDLYSLSRVEQRLRALVAEAKRGPMGGLWPPREDLDALLRMLEGTLNNRGEQRLRLTIRTALSLTRHRTPAALWSQGLEQLLEEAATRSYVLKKAEGRPLESESPSPTLKQRAIAMGARVASKFATTRAGTAG